MARHYTMSILAQLKPNPQWAMLPLVNCKNWSRLQLVDAVENLKDYHFLSASDDQVDR